MSNISHRTKAEKLPSRNEKNSRCPSSSRERYIMQLNCPAFLPALFVPCCVPWPASSHPFPLPLVSRFIHSRLPNAVCYRTAFWLWIDNGCATGFCLLRGTRRIRAITPGATAVTSPGSLPSCMRVLTVSLCEVGGRVWPLSFSSTLWWETLGKEVDVGEGSRPA